MLHAQNRVLRKIFFCPKYCARATAQQLINAPIKIYIVDTPERYKLLRGSRVGSGL